MRIVVVLVALAGVLAATAHAATPFDYSKRPVCQVRNPPFEPHVVAGSFIHGEISQRCAGPVWRMGIYACLQSKRVGKIQPWRVVWCEANEVFFSQGMTVKVEDYVKPAPGDALWFWRVSGYVWVDYEPGPSGFYKFPNLAGGTLRSADLVTAFRPDQREGGR